MINVLRQVDLEALHSVVDRSRDARPAWEKVLMAWRAQIAEEFATGRTAGGARWVPRQPFGNDPGGPATLQRSGLLLRTWLGGPGSIAEVSADGVRFGVSGKHVPYAKRHRSGGKVFVTPGRRGFLAAQGRPLRASTRELVTPARPHAVVNPEIRQTAVLIFRRFLASGDGVPASEVTP